MAWFNSPKPSKPVETHAVVSSREAPAFGIKDISLWGAKPGLPYYIICVYVSPTAAFHEELKYCLRKDPEHAERRGRGHRFDPECPRNYIDRPGRYTEECNVIYIAQFGDQRPWGQLIPTNGFYTGLDGHPRSFELNQRMQAQCDALPEQARLRQVPLIPQLHRLQTAVDAFAEALQSRGRSVIRIVFKIVANSAREHCTTEERVGFARAFNPSPKGAPRWIWGADAGPCRERWRDPNEDMPHYYYEPTKQATQFFRELGAGERPAKKHMGCGKPLVITGTCHIEELKHTGYFYAHLHTRLPTRRRFFLCKRESIS